VEVLPHEVSWSRLVVSPARQQTIVA
jgi:hypothetical protein